MILPFHNFAVQSLAVSLLTGLMGYWTLDEVSGSRADSSGNSFTLTDIGSTLGSAAGIINLGAMSTGGGGSRVLSHGDDVKLKAGTGVSWSVSIWIAVNSGAYPGTIASKSYDVFTATAGEWALRVDTGTPGVPMYLTVWDTSGNNTVLTTGVGGSAMHHVVITFDDSTKLLSIYINAVLNNSATLLNSVNGTTRPFNLFNSDNSPYNIGGVIDECGYWHVALTSAQVTQLYNAGSGLPFSSF